MTSYGERHPRVQLLVAEKYDPAVNWATHVDMRTGRPQVVRQFSTRAGGEVLDTCIQRHRSAV